MPTHHQHQETNNETPPSHPWPMYDGFINRGAQVIAMTHRSNAPRAFGQYQNLPKKTYKTQMLHGSQDSLAIPPTLHTAHRGSPSVKIMKLSPLHCRLIMIDIQIKPPQLDLKANDSAFWYTHLSCLCRSREPPWSVVRCRFF